MTETFPKRSVPYLLSTAPLGGLMPPPVRRHRWFIRHSTDSTILITACNELNCRIIASRHTKWSAGLKAMSFQFCTEPIRLFIFSFFPSIVKDELAVLQRRTAVVLPAEPRITFTFCCYRAFFHIIE